MTSLLNTEGAFPREGPFWLHRKGGAAAFLFQKGALSIAPALRLWYDRLRTKGPTETIRK